MIQEQPATDVNENPYRKCTVTLKRSPALDFWGRKMKIAKIHAGNLVVTLPHVEDTLKNFGINLEQQWEGWSDFDEKHESKITNLKEIIEEAKNSADITAPHIESWQEQGGINNQLIKNKLANGVTPSHTSFYRKKGTKRKRESEVSCSDQEKSDEETEHDKTLASDVVEGHNYLICEGASEVNNMIYSLLKVVGEVDQDCEKEHQYNKENRSNKTLGEMQENEPDFLGFDDLRGLWRGWENVSIKNLQRINDLIKNQVGRRDMEQELGECILAVTRDLEIVDGKKSNVKELKSNKSGNADAVIENILKKLLGMFGKVTEEPPFSYTVLIVMAICSISKPSATVSEICHFIYQQFPFYRSGYTESLQALVEKVLEFSPIFIKACQGCRRLADHAGCWRVEDSDSYRILQNAFEFAEIKMQKKDLIEYKKSTLVKNGIEVKNDVEREAKKFKHEVTKETKMLLSNNALYPKKCELQLKKNLHIKAEVYNDVRKKVDKEKVCLENNQKIVKFQNQHTIVTNVKKNSAKITQKSCVLSAVPNLLTTKNSNNLKCESDIVTHKRPNVISYVNKDSTIQIREKVFSKLSNIISANANFATQTVNPAYSGEVCGIKIGRDSFEINNVDEKDKLESDEIDSSLQINKQSSFGCNYDRIKTSADYSQARNVVEEGKKMEVIDLTLQDNVHPSLNTDDSEMNSSADSLHIIDVEEQNELGIIGNAFDVQINKQSSLNNDEKQIIDIYDNNSEVVQAEDGSFRCVECSLIFQCGFLFKCHKLDHSGQKQHPCFRCHKLFPSINVLWIHTVKAHLGEDNVHVMSPSCKSLQWKMNVNKNIKTTPGNCNSNLQSELVIPKSKQETNTETVREFNCSYCSHFTSFSSVDSLQSHLKFAHSHNGVLRYTCSSCKAVFNDKGVLNLHVAFVHHDEAMKSLASFKQVSTTEGIRFYCCNSCFECFDTEKSLSVHKCFPEKH